MQPRLAVLVPTRNRPQLVATAVRSILATSLRDVSVVVSDNSSPEVRREVLRVLEGLDVTVVLTPEELPMADHWSWALDQVLDATEPSHVGVLTDRFVYKRDALRALSTRLIPAFPDDVIVHNHDHLADLTAQVQVIFEVGSGCVVSVRPTAVLDRVAAGEAWNWELPRMMNSIVPVKLLEAVRARAGRVFGSIAPDHYLGYWLAALEDRFVCWDASPSVHHAQMRSNGFAQATGDDRSADAGDFKRRSLTRDLNTPFPTVHTLSNFIFHEYATVAAESGSSRFAPLDHDVVAAALRRDATRDVADPELRAAVLHIVGGPEGQAAASAAPAEVSWRRTFRRRRQRATDLTLRALDPELVARLGRGRADVVERLVFPTSEAALEVAVRTNRRAAATKPVGTSAKLLEPFWP